VGKLTPQEKKRLSYERDRRNTYGENDKASRKAIPLRKRLAARAVRHAGHAVLPRNRDVVPEEEVERVENRMLSAQRKAQLAWRKVPDVPLGEYLARKRARRVETSADADS
jgi:hypothetical protein